MSLRLVLSIGLLATASAMVLAVPARAQQADEDPAATAPKKSAPSGESQQHPNEAHMPASGEATTQEINYYSGNIIQENGEVVLQDLVTKVINKLDEPAKAKGYIGKRVKITGKLDGNTNVIRVEKIEPAE
jgi:hypothetical protein